MSDRIVGSDKNEDGEISVFFGNKNTNDSYYAHSITSLGSERDNPSKMSTAWAWVNHMRRKMWWNGLLEREFFAEVNKYL